MAPLRRAVCHSPSPDTYSAHGGTSCNVSRISPYPMGGIAYAEGQAQQVQVHATVTVTYAMQ